jgi:hypothetical protein
MNVNNGFILHAEEDVQVCARRTLFATLVRVTVFRLEARPVVFRPDSPFF